MMTTERRAELAPMAQAQIRLNLSGKRNIACFKVRYAKTHAYWLIAAAFPHEDPAKCTECGAVNFSYPFRVFLRQHFPEPGPDCVRIERSGEGDGADVRRALLPAMEWAELTGAEWVFSVQE